MWIGDGLRVDHEQILGALGARPQPTTIRRKGRALYDGSLLQDTSATAKVVRQSGTARLLSRPKNEASHLRNPWQTLRVSETSTKMSSVAPHSPADLRGYSGAKSVDC
jgi:hypothetical protein